MASDDAPAPERPLQEEGDTVPKATVSTTPNTVYQPVFSMLCAYLRILKTGGEVPETHEMVGRREWVVVEKGASVTVSTVG